MLSSGHNAFYNCGIEMQIKLATKVFLLKFSNIKFKKKNPFSVYRIQTDGLIKQL